MLRQKATFYFQRMLEMCISHQVCVRMKQYKDELLASCLTFVLSLHSNMVALDIKAYCPALEVRLFFVLHRMLCCHA